MLSNINYYIRNIFFCQEIFTNNLKYLNTIDHHFIYKDFPRTYGYVIIFFYIDVIHIKNIQKRSIIYYYGNFETYVIYDT